VRENSNEENGGKQGSNNGGKEYNFYRLPLTHTPQDRDLDGRTKAN
jgi:hypothetical protein